MSSSEQEEFHLGIFNEEEDGGAMDVEILDSSSHDDGEQDRLVDETIPKQESTPKVTDTATAGEKMESSPGVANDAAKAVDNVVAEAGNENPNLHEIPVEPMTTDR